MNLISFSEPVSFCFRKTAGAATVTLEAFKPHVFSDTQLESITKHEEINTKIYKVSKMSSRIRNFHVSARKAGANKVLIYNGSGGYGDQIMTWPVAWLLHCLGFEVHVLSDPGNQVCWWNFTWVKAVHVLPLQYDLFTMFDYHAIFEDVTNMDEHQDQRHSVDSMLYRIGIDPEGVSPEVKVVHPVFTPGELCEYNRLKDKKIAIYQLSAANPVRSLTPNDSAFLLSKLAVSFPDLHWLAIYDDMVPKPYAQSILVDDDGKMTPMEKNIEPYSSPFLRQLWALTRAAHVVVSPDSMMVHVAGSMEIPCVGLWGPTSPRNRVAYYKNHFPVLNSEACPQAPCFCYTNGFPKYCPVSKVGPRTTCEVMAAISPKQVIDTILKNVYKK